jgi:signal transduction histidine kinase
MRLNQKRYRVGKYNKKVFNYKNQRVKSLLLEISGKNSELIEKNNEIVGMNKELSSLNEELYTMNECLEEIVKFRTKELELRNAQLTEYAFINSHMLRAPLSRILGLSFLLSKEATTIKDSQISAIVDGLLTSTNELDLIVRKISNVLYEGNNLTREEINTVSAKIQCG